jgi:hypothetical protein
MSESVANENHQPQGRKKGQAQQQKPDASPESSSSEMVEEIKEQKENNNGTQNGSHDDVVDVIIIFLPKHDKEFIPNVRVALKDNGDLDLCELLKSLKAMTFPVERNMISYYSYSGDMYVYCGNDPIPPNSVIPAREVATNGQTRQVTIRIRQIQSSFPMAPEPIFDKESIKVENPESNAAGAPKQKRTKERKIGEILDKVLQWRRLYTGVIDPQTGYTVKMSLEEAAQRVAISKKSLDDYLLQIRFGKKYGFNFNDHYNERVGVLRAFVKKFKNKIPEKGDDKEDFGEIDSLIEKGKSKDTKTEHMSLSRNSKKIHK